MTVRSDGEICTVSGQVGAGDEQVDSLGFGVGTGELHLFAEVVALGAGGHDSDCALLDLNLNLIVLVVMACLRSEVLLYTDGVLLGVGPVCGRPLNSSRTCLIERDVRIFKSYRCR